MPSVVLRLPAVIPSFFFADNKVFRLIPFLVASSSISLEETSLSAPKYSLIKAMATSNFLRPLPSFPASNSSTVMSYGPIHSNPLSSDISKPMESPAAARLDLSYAIMRMLGLSGILATSNTLLAVA